MSLRQLWYRAYIPSILVPFILHDLTSALSRITTGHLRVLTAESDYHFGEDPEHATRKAEIRVKSSTFWLRLGTMGDLGFSEAFMYGEAECDDLVSLFQVSPNTPRHHYIAGAHHKQPK